MYIHAAPYKLNVAFSGPELANPSVIVQHQSVVLVLQRTSMNSLQISKKSQRRQMMRSIYEQTRVTEHITEAIINIVHAEEYLYILRCPCIS